METFPEDIPLADQHCTPCHGGIPPLPKEAVLDQLVRLPGWFLLDNPVRIERSARFSNFADARDFANRVADLCESENHHAEITFGWGHAKIAFWTHAIGGIHMNDLVMAAKVSEFLDDL